MVAGFNVLEKLPGKLPQVPIPDDVHFPTVAKHVFDAFPNLEEQHFTKDAIWRDSFALTGAYRTFYSGAKAAKIWDQLSSQHNVSGASPAETGVLVRPTSTSAWVEFPFTFSTSSPATACFGSLSLVPAEDGTWKIWMLKTVLQQLSGHGNVDFLQPALKPAIGDAARLPSDDPSVQLDGACNGGEADLQDGAPDVGNEQGQFQCIVIGGGQAGLSVGGRLQALGIKYVILDKLEQVGDAWRQRYARARLHTIREYSHLPFDRTFGSDCGEYLHKDVLGRGHQEWAEWFGINIWNSTTVESGTWDATAQLYHVTIRRNGCVSTITAPHVVIATGANSQTPVMPNLPGKEHFKGLVLHSAEYHDAAQWAGKTGVVVGTANTAHDVADDMLEAGMNVTMVQRNRTFVVPVESCDAYYQPLYNEHTPTEISDRTVFSGPMAITRLIANTYLHPIARAQPERWAALEKAGFRVEPLGDIIETINVRLGGHYIDVGTSAKIAQGLIKVKSNALATAYTESGLAFSDGTELKADVIVFGTGFVGNMRHQVEQIFGQEVGDRAGDCFGVDEEGEILGACRPLAQPGMWYIGGTLGMARHYSRFIALSVKASALGAPLPVYNERQYGL